MLWNPWGLPDASAVNPHLASLIGAGLRRRLACAYTGENWLKSQRLVNVCDSRHSEVEAVGPRSDGQGEAAQPAPPLELPEAAQDGQEDDSRREEV